MLKETLTIDLVTTELAGRDKNEIIRSMLDLVCKSGKVKDPEAALKAGLRAALAPAPDTPVVR